jgi:hypothetical protein
MNIKQQSTIDLTSRLIELQNEYATIEAELTQRQKVKYKVKQKVRLCKLPTETQAEYRKRYQKAYQEHYKLTGRKQEAAKRYSFELGEPFERKRNYDKFTK